MEPARRHRQYRDHRGDQFCTRRLQFLVDSIVIATFPYSFSYSFSKLGYDSHEDLAPVGGIGVTPQSITLTEDNGSRQQRRD